MIDLCAAFFHLKILGQCIEQLSRRQAIEIFDQPIVIDNFQLVVGENNRQEIAVLLLAGMVRILFHLLLTNTCSRSRTMMTISYIQCRNLGKDFSNLLLSRLIVNHPKTVTKPISSHKIINRIVVRNNAVNNLIDLLIGRIGEKDRLHIGILDPYVNHTILLLIGTGQFMFFDFTLQVIIKMTGRYQSILCPAIHGLGIDIILLSIVLHQPSLFSPGPKILDCTGIHLIGMLVSYRSKINLGFDNMKQRFFRCLLFCLLRIEHIIRT